MDPHWQPQYDICRPCYVNYDYIINYETVHDDANYILRKVAPKSNVQFPQNESNLRSSSEYMKMYETVPTRLIRQILDVYQNDYNMFGYKIPDILRRRIENVKTF